MPNAYQKMGIFFHPHLNSVVPNLGNSYFFVFEAS